MSTQIPVKQDEKVTPVMVYSYNRMSWGAVVTKKVIRVGAWMRTSMAPAYMILYQAQTLHLTSDTPDKPTALPEFHIPASQIIGFHVMPSVKEPLYYNPEEENRKMEPVQVLIDTFHFKGGLFMSTQSTMEQYLDVTREPFIPLFNVEITHPRMPKPGIVKVPYCVISNKDSLFATGH